MFCPACGEENPEGSKFCSNCAREIPLLPSNTPTQGMQGSSFIPYPQSSEQTTEKWPNVYQDKPQDIYQDRPSSYNYPPQNYQAYPPQNQQNYPPATNYGQGGQYDYYQPFGQVREKASGKALAALVLAIVSIFPGICFSFGAIALAIVAVILGKQELELISKGAAPKAGETFAKVGFYLGITGAVLNSLLGLAFCASSFLSRL